MVAGSLLTTNERQRICHIYRHFTVPLVNGRFLKSYRHDPINETPEPLAGQILILVFLIGEGSN